MPTDLTLRANPEVRVAVGGGPALPYRARVMPDDERARWWPVITARHRNYARYQRRTARVIPLVVLEPVAGAAGSEAGPDAGPDAAPGVTG